jgi:hypothetical protein
MRLRDALKLHNGDEVTLKADWSIRVAVVHSFHVEGKAAYFNLITRPGNEYLRNIRHTEFT